MQAQAARDAYREQKLQTGMSLQDSEDAVQATRKGLRHQEQVWLCNGKSTEKH